MTYAPRLCEKDERKMERERKRKATEKRGEKKELLQAYRQQGNHCERVQPHKYNPTQSFGSQCNFILEIRLDSFFCCSIFCLQQEKKKGPIQSLTLSNTELRASGRALTGLTF